MVSVGAYRRQSVKTYKLPKGQPVSDRKRLSYLYNRQNSFLEEQPKKFDNRTLGLFLEHIGDVYRELTMRFYPDANYIDEKLRRAGRLLHFDFRPEGLFERERPLVVEDQKLLFSLHSNLTGAWDGTSFKSLHAQLDDKVYASILDTWYTLYEEATKDLRDEAALFDAFHELACAIKSASAKDYLAGRSSMAENYCTRRRL